MNIDELPVRCLVHRTLAGTEVAARLVDTPAERYRASFAFIYMVSAESQEHYKQVRGEGRGHAVRGVLLEKATIESLPTGFFVFSGWRAVQVGTGSRKPREREATIYLVLGGAVDDSLVPAKQAFPLPPSVQTHTAK